jgi:hypothetical protein
MSSSTPHGQGKRARPHARKGRRLQVSRGILELVRVLAIVAGVVTGVTSLAYAGPSAAELESEGQQLAKDGRYTEAVTAFKAADRLQPTAGHACLIALAYTRRELWPQAEVFLATCHERATAADPLPDWVPLAEKQLAERLAAIEVAAVSIKVDPADAPAQLTVSSFAPDESFGPRTIHLPTGHHTIIVTAAGFETERHELEITDKTAQDVVIKLYRPGERPTAKPQLVVRESSKVPILLFGAGGTLGVAGLIVHIFLYWPARKDLETDSQTGNLTQYQADEGKYDTRRLLTLGLYGASALAIGAGLVLKYTVFKHHDEAPLVSIVPQAGGGMVSLGWQR